MMEDSNLDTDGDKYLCYFLETTPKKWSWVGFLKYLDNNSLSKGENSDNGMYCIYLRRLSSNANLSKLIQDTAAKKNSDVQIKKQRQNAQKYWKERLGKENKCDLDFVTQEIIENEKRIGIPALPSRIKNLIHNLNALNEYDQSEKEKKFIEGLFHIMLHFASLFSKNALILDTELDVGVTYIYKPLDIIRNWADVNMEICSNEDESRMMMDVGTTIDGWEIFAHENCFVQPSTSKKVYKDRHKTAIYNRHKGLHWELFTMRQPHPRVFYWTQVLNTPLPSQNSKKSFLTFTLPLETVFTLALGLEETSENICKVNQTIVEIRF
ncbi:1276_t:CDS:2, partial [Entrophospora sp. SA101]